MKNILLTMMRLITGFWVCSVGVVLMINAKLGLAPWDVLHEGLAKNLGITMGQSSMLVGLIVIFLNIFLKEYIGWGTVLNMIMIGIFIDILMLNNIIPISTSFTMSILMLLLGMLILSYGCYLYIGASIGSGARDGMMAAIVRKTGKPVKLVRGGLELTALIFGYFLGGTVGIGTIITSLGIGFCVQYVFKICKFNVAAIEHRYIFHDLLELKKILKR